MSDIQRYAAFYASYECDTGEYIHFKDHQREIAAKDATIAELKNVLSLGKTLIDELIFSKRLNSSMIPKISATGKKITNKDVEEAFDELPNPPTFSLTDLRKGLHDEMLCELANFPDRKNPISIGIRDILIDFCLSKNLIQLNQNEPS